MTIHALAAAEPRAALKPFTYDPGPIGPDEVDIAITHSGICHSDIHLLDNDWQITAYPFVPGHEIVGTVRSVGAAAALKAGQRVGVGWQCKACYSCEWCLAGEEPVCSANQGVCVGRHGGFADVVRVDWRFAHPIPDGLPGETAAPLLCGGITVYTPLKKHTQPGMRVGVIGIGGLGHLAVQFAAAFGCEVTAFSTSPDKADEARKLGATHFINSRDARQMEAAANSLDYILSTVMVTLDWNAWLKLLRPFGTFCIVGASPGEIAVSAWDLLSGQKAIRGSIIGGRGIIREMLAYADRMKIRAMSELAPLSEANAAIERVRNNAARYRVVLTNP